MMAEHLHIADVILADWRAGGFLDRYQAEMAAWIVEFVAYDVLFLPATDRDRLLEGVADLLRKYWTPGELDALPIAPATRAILEASLVWEARERPAREASPTRVLQAAVRHQERGAQAASEVTARMQARVYMICRTNGKLYLDVRLSEEERLDGLSAYAMAGNKRFPAQVFPAADGADSATRWVVTIPFLAFDHADVVIEGSRGAYPALHVNFKRAKLLSLLNARLRRDAFESVVACEGNAVGIATQMRLLRFLEGEDDTAIWRMDVTEGAHGDNEDEIEVFDGFGNPVEFRTLPLRGPGRGHGWHQGKTQGLFAARSLRSRLLLRHRGRRLLLVRRSFLQREAHRDPGLHEGRLRGRGAIPRVAGRAQGEPRGPGRAGAGHARGAAEVQHCCSRLRAQRRVPERLHLVGRAPELCQLGACWLVDASPHDGIAARCLEPMCDERISAPASSSETSALRATPTSASRTRRGIGLRFSTTTTSSNPMRSSAMRVRSPVTRTPRRCSATRTPSRSMGSTAFRCSRASSIWTSCTPTTA